VVPLGLGRVVAADNSALVVVAHPGAVHLPNHLHDHLSVVDLVFVAAHLGGNNYNYLSSPLYSHSFVGN
jgi:hypothetical protein